MRIIEENQNVKHVEFLYAEFADFAESRTRSKKSVMRGENSSRRKDNSSNPWSGVNDFEQALELARHGWDAGLSQLPLEAGILSETGVEIENSVAGAMVNIGNYLMGQPECMINFRETREFNLEELLIYVRLDYNAGNSYETAMKFCTSVAEVVNFYQSKYNVKIIGRFDTKEAGINSIVDVVIKDFDQRFVINNVAFAFHPAFFRRLWFAYLESEEFIALGYGSTSNYNKINSEIIKNIGTKLAVVTPHIESTDGGVFGMDKVTKFNML